MEGFRYKHSGNINERVDIIMTLEKKIESLKSIISALEADKENQRVRIEIAEKALNQISKWPDYDGFHPRAGVAREALDKLRE